MFVIITNTMEVVKKGDLVLLKFPALSKLDFINHAVSTRHGGVSVKEGLRSLNLGSKTGDDIENVRENYRRFCSAAGFDPMRIVLGNQTHSDNVRYVTEEDMGKGVFRERDYSDVDALVTDKRQIPLVIHTADCVPVAFADKKGRAIGNAHCGWRGTSARLAEKTAAEMKRLFGVEPADLVCTIGPCICMSCYEVSQELYVDFEAKFGKSEALKNKNGRFYIDLARINFQVLCEFGVKAENISISDLCTCCNTDSLFSHRGQGPGRGILASCIELL